MSFYLIALTCVCMLLKNRLLLVTYQAKGLTPIRGLYLECRRVYTPGPASDSFVNSHALLLTTRSCKNGCRGVLSWWRVRSQFNRTFKDNWQKWGYRVLSIILWFYLHFYQPVARKVHGWLVLELLFIFHVYILACASALITCTITTSHTLLPALCSYYE